MHIYIRKKKMVKIVRRRWRNNSKIIYVKNNEFKFSQNVQAYIKKLYYAIRTLK